MEIIPALEPRQLDGTAEEIALGIVDAGADQRTALEWRLDPLGDDFEPHAPAHRQDGLQQLPSPVQIHQCAGEGHVDLDDTDGQHRQRARRGMTGTEVVDREQGAGHAHLRYGVLQPLGVATGHAAAQLEDQAAGIAELGDEQAGQLAGARPLEREIREVDGEELEPQSTQPLLVLGDARDEILRQDVDQTARFGDWNEVPCIQDASVAEPQSRQHLHTAQPTVYGRDDRLIERQDTPRMDALRQRIGVEIRSGRARGPEPVRASPRGTSRGGFETLFLVEAMSSHRIDLAGPCVTTGDLEK